MLSLCECAASLFLHVCVLTGGGGGSFLRSVVVNEPLLLCTYCDDKLYAHALRQTALFCLLICTPPDFRFLALILNARTAQQQQQAGDACLWQNWGKKLPRRTSSNKVALPFSFELVKCKWTLYNQAFFNFLPNLDYHFNYLKIYSTA